MLADGRIHVTFPPRPHDQQVLPPVAPFYDMRSEPRARVHRHACKTPGRQLEFNAFRGRWAWKNKTKPMRPLTRREKKDGQSLAYWKRVAANERPTHRDQCRTGPRPCPYIACKFHLFLDVSPISGSIKYNFPLAPTVPKGMNGPAIRSLELDEALHLMRDTCALDVMDRGGVTLEEVGVLLNVSMERSRQIQQAALGKTREKVDDDYCYEGGDEPEGDDDGTAW